MKSISTSSKVAFAFAIAAALLFSQNTYANTTNSLPGGYSDSFEGLSNGESIVGTNGWYGATNSYATASNAIYSYSGTYPLNATSHLTHIVLDTENGVLTNMTDSGDASGFEVYFDMMMLPTRWTDEEYPAMTNDTSIEVGLFFNSNGNPVVYHAFDPFTTMSNTFTVIPEVTLPSNTWTRVTITQSNLSGLACCQIQLDGTALTNAKAFTPATAYGGSWFVNADNATASDGFFITSIEFSGTGFLDDFVFTDQAPAFSIMWAIVASVNNAMGASISPEGTNYYPQGSTQTVSITYSNFWDQVVTVDGLITTPPPASVTFENLTASHTVTVASAVQTTTSVTGVDVPRWWLNDYAGDPDIPDGDGDSDTLSNWEEWLASTDPNDTASTFEILEHYVTDGTGYVVWVSKAIDPTLPPFAVERSTNLTAGGGGWLVVDDSVSRGAGPDGTNLWQDAAPPPADVAVFYRVSATN